MIIMNKLNKIQIKKLTRKDIIGVILLIIFLFSAAIHIFTSSTEDVENARKYIDILKQKPNFKNYNFAQNAVSKVENENTAELMREEIKIYSTAAYTPEIKAVMIAYNEFTEKLDKESYDALEKAILKIRNEEDKEYLLKELLYANKDKVKGEK